MIIRVRSSVGIWRVTVEVGASVLNIKRTLAKSYGLDADSQVLSHDPGGDSTLPDDFVGLQHGDLVHLQGSVCRSKPFPGAPPNALPRFQFATSNDDKTSDEPDMNSRNTRSFLGGGGERTGKSELSDGYVRGQGGDDGDGSTYCGSGAGGGGGGGGGGNVGGGGGGSGGGEEDANSVRAADSFRTERLVGPDLDSFPVSPDMAAAIAASMADADDDYSARHRSVQHRYGHAAAAASTAMDLGAVLGVTDAPDWLDEVAAEALAAQAARDAASLDEELARFLQEAETRPLKDDRRDQARSHQHHGHRRGTSAQAAASPMPRRSPGRTIIESVNSRVGMMQGAVRTRATDLEREPGALVDLSVEDSPVRVLARSQASEGTALGVDDDDDDDDDDSGLLPGDELDLALALRLSALSSPSTNRGPSVAFARPAGPTTETAEQLQSASARAGRIPNIQEKLPRPSSMRLASPRRSNSGHGDSVQSDLRAIEEEAYLRRVAHGTRGESHTNASTTAFSRRPPPNPRASSRRIPTAEAEAAATAEALAKRLGMHSQSSEVAISGARRVEYGNDGPSYGFLGSNDERRAEIRALDSALRQASPRPSPRSPRTTSAHVPRPAPASRVGPVRSVTEATAPLHAFSQAASSAAAKLSADIEAAANAGGLGFRHSNAAQHLGSGLEALEANSSSPMSRHLRQAEDHAPAAARAERGSRSGRSGEWVSPPMRTEGEGVVSTNTGFERRDSVPVVNRPSPRRSTVSSPSSQRRHHRAIPSSRVGGSVQREVDDAHGVSSAQSEELELAEALRISLATSLVEGRSRGRHGFYSARANGHSSNRSERLSTRHGECFETDGGDEELRRAIEESMRGKRSSSSDQTYHTET